MKNTEIIYVPIVVQETERPKWDPFLFNDSPEAGRVFDVGTELSTGIFEYTCAFSETGALEAVRGELDAIVASETSIDTDATAASSSEEQGTELGSSETVGSEAEGPDSEGSNGDSEGSDSGDE